MAPSTNSSAPRNRNGLRLPKRPVVRSLSLPSAGNAINENTDPTPTTTDRIVVADAGSMMVALSDSVRTAGTRFAIPAPIAAKPRKNR